HLGRPVRGAETRAGRDRLELLDRHAQTPSKISIVSPSRSVTTAFFQAARRPTRRPTRRSLPAYRMVRTLSTFTGKSFSTARAISTLFASRATTNEYFR